MRGLINLRMASGFGFHFQAIKREKCNVFMKYNGIFIIGFVGCLCLVFAAFCQDDLKPWEQYGLSQSEWKIIQDNKISLDKVHVLLSCGISIGEYSKKPWNELGMTEGDWIEKRRSGFTSYDIELEAKSNPRHWKVDTNNVSSDYSSFSSGKNQLLGFVFPGYQQLRLKERSKGSIMSGLAISSLLGCLAGTLLENRFEARPLYIVLAPDMLWSFIDFTITLSTMRKGPQ